MSASAYRPSEPGEPTKEAWGYASQTMNEADGLNGKGNILYGWEERGLKCGICAIEGGNAVARRWRLGKASGGFRVDNVT